MTKLLLCNSLGLFTIVNLGASYMILTNTDSAIAELLRGKSSYQSVIYSINSNTNSIYLKEIKHILSMRKG